MSSFDSDFSAQFAGSAAPPPPSLSNVELAVSGALAGCIAWASTFPLDVIKTRIQAESVAASSDALATRSSSSALTNARQGAWWRRSAVISTARRTYAQEGMGAFFKGIGPTLLRAIPANAVLFVSFEATKSALQRAGI